jgi:hypothetical protein
LCFVSVNGPRETYFVDEPNTIQNPMYKGEHCHHKPALSAGKFL